MLMYDGLHWTETIFVGFNLNITKKGTQQKFCKNPLKQKIYDTQGKKNFLRHSVLGPIGSSTGNK